MISTGRKHPTIVFRGGGGGRPRKFPYSRYSRRLIHMTNQGSEQVTTGHPL